MQDITLLMVRTAIARQLRMPLGSVHPRHSLDGDLELDPLDLAFVLIDIEDITGVDLPMPELEGDPTVEELARALEPTIESDRARWRATGTH